MFLRGCHCLSSVISVGNIPNHCVVGHYGTFVVMCEQEAGSIEVAAAAVVGGVKDVAGQLALNGEDGIGGEGGAVADVVPHQICEVTDITFDILVDFHVHVDSFLLEVVVLYCT